MEMMDSANLPLAQSTSEVDNRFNGWNAPLFKVALCPREPSSCALAQRIGIWIRSDFGSRTRPFPLAGDRQN